MLACPIISFFSEYLLYQVRFQWNEHFKLTMQVGSPHVNFVYLRAISQCVITLTHYLSPFPEPNTSSQCPSTNPGLSRLPIQTQRGIIQIFHWTVLSTPSLRCNQIPIDTRNGQLTVGLCCKHIEDYLQPNKTCKATMVNPYHIVSLNFFIAFLHNIYQYLELAVIFPLYSNKQYYEI